MTTLDQRVLVDMQKSLMSLGSRMGCFFLLLLFLGAEEDVSWLVEVVSLNAAFSVDRVRVGVVTCGCGRGWM